MGGNEFSLTEESQLINIQKRNGHHLEHHSNNCCSQDPPMKAKISSQNFK